MKLQIKSHSIRFRITAEELQELLTHGRVACETRVPQTGGETAVLQYEMQYSPEVGASGLEMSPYAIKLVLAKADFAQLADLENEGVYIRREYVGSTGKMIRFLAYVEKDMKSKKIKKHKKTKATKGHEATADQHLDDKQSTEPEVNEL